MQHQFNRHSIRLRGYDYSKEGLYFITICCQDKIHRFGEIVNGVMILNDAGKQAQICWLAIPEHFTNVVLHDFVVMPNHIHGIIEITAPPVGTNHHLSFANHHLSFANHHLSFANHHLSFANHHLSFANHHLSDYDEKNILHNGAKNVSGNGAKNVSGNGAKNVSGNGAKNVSPLPHGTSRTVGSIVRGFKIGVTKWFIKNYDTKNIWQRNYYEHIIRDENAYQNISNYIQNNPLSWEKDKFR